MDARLTEEEVVLALLSRRIAETRRLVANEREHPSSDPDKMDETIKQGLKDLDTLYRIRQELESIFFGDTGHDHP